MSMIRRTANVMMDLGAAMLPETQGEWMRAMRTEAAHVADKAVLGFAAGCLLACLRERLRLAADIAAPLRQGLVVALLLCAAFTVRSGLRLADADPSTAWVFGGIGTLYTFAAIGGLLSGGALVTAGLLLLPLSLGAAVWLAGVPRGLPAVSSAIDVSLVSALAVEGTVIWLAVLGRGDVLTKSAWVKDGLGEKAGAGGWPCRGMSMVFGTISGSV